MPEPGLQWKHSMKALMRNQLVSINERGWAKIEDQAWDGQAQEILAHWRANRLPLVVCRQQEETPADQVGVGLPAPQKWSRRRMALMVRQDHITACFDFPTLAQMAQQNHWSPAAHELAEALDILAVPARVYGSHAWQWITGLTYLHETSDIDLSLDVNATDMAYQVVNLLARTQLHGRIDGEIIFPEGQAIAWRELQMLFKGQVSQVLVKNRNSAWLLCSEDVHRLGQGFKHG
jgi:phosphoribosyl-dephospho-CoA transferase